MDKKTNTEILNEKILKSNNIREFLDNNKDAINTASFADALYSFITIKNLKNSDFFRASDLSESYGYQLLNGKRQPSRDKVIQCSLGLSLSVAETNTLLKLAEKSELYVRNKRDAIILYSLNNQLSLIQSNMLLDEENEKVIQWFFVFFF